MRPTQLGDASVDRLPVEPPGLAGNGMRQPRARPSASPSPSPSPSKVATNGAVGGQARPRPNTAPQQTLQQGPSAKGASRKAAAAGREPAPLGKSGATGGKPGATPTPKTPAHSRGASPVGAKPVGPKASKTAGVATARTSAGGAKRARVPTDDDSVGKAVKKQARANPGAPSLAVNPLQALNAAAASRAARAAPNAEVSASKSRRAAVLNDCLRSITCSKEAVHKAKDACFQLAKGGHGPGLCDDILEVAQQLRAAPQKLALLYVLDALMTGIAKLGSKHGAGITADDLHALQIFRNNVLSRLPTILAAVTLVANAIDVDRTIEFWVKKHLLTEDARQSALHAIEKPLAEARRTACNKKRPNGWLLVPVGDQTLDLARVFLWNQYGSFGGDDAPSLGDSRKPPLEMVVRSNMLHLKFKPAFAKRTVNWDSWDEDACEWGHFDARTTDDSQTVGTEWEVEEDEAPAAKAGSRRETHSQHQHQGSSDHRRPPPPAMGAGPRLPAPPLGLADMYGQAGAPRPPPLVPSVAAVSQGPYDDGLYAPSRDVGARPFWLDPAFEARGDVGADMLDEPEYDDQGMRIHPEQPYFAAPGPDLMGANANGGGDAHLPRLPLSQQYGHSATRDDDDFGFELYEPEMASSPDEAPPLPPGPPPPTSPTHDELYDEPPPLPDGDFPAAPEPAEPPPLPDVVAPPLPAEPPAPLPPSMSFGGRGLLPPPPPMLAFTPPAGPRGGGFYGGLAGQPAGLHEYGPRRFTPEPPQMAPRAPPFPAATLPPPPFPPQQPSYNVYGSYTQWQ